MMHRELHHLSRYFYSSTNEISIEPCTIGDAQSISQSAANVIVKAISSRRKIEVPDEDSSFLLRAQVCFSLVACEQLWQVVISFDRRRKCSILIA